jgi:hypothetical protein
MKEYLANLNSDAAPDCGNLSVLYLMEQIFSIYIHYNTHRSTKNWHFKWAENRAWLSSFQSVFTGRES